MAFTDPILSGDELVRGSITSENYTAGVNGWGIHKDGSAEFQDLTVRHNLNVGGSILINGKDIWLAAHNHSLGVIAWMQAWANTTTTTEAPLFYLEADCSPGRIYEAIFFNLTNHPSSGSNPADYIMRIEFGTSGWPTNGSYAIASVRIVGQQPVYLNQLFGVPNIGSPMTRVRLRTSIKAVTGTVTSNTPIGDSTLAIIDHAVQPPYSGAVGAPPGKTLKEFTVPIFNHKSYESVSGAAYNGTGDDDWMWQGDYKDGHGIRESWMIFSTANDALIADLVSVPYADVLLCEVYFNVGWWHDGFGYVDVGYHNKGVLSNTTKPSGGVPNKQYAYWPGTGGQWMDLKINGDVANSIMDSIKTGYFKGFMVGNALATTDHTGSIMGWHATDPPKFHVKYYK